MKFDENASCSIPFNVFQSPVPQQISAFTDTFNDLKNAYDEFSKTGAVDVLKSHLMIAWGAYSTGKVDYLALTKATISLAGFIPGAGAAVPFINMFVDLVWPHLFGGGSGNQYTELFNMIMEAVEKLVDQKFSVYIISNLQDYLEGMQTQLVHFQNSIEDAIGQGGSPGYQSILDVQTPDINRLNDVKEKFGLARTTIESNLPHFKDPLDQVSQNPDFKRETVQVTLPLYTTAATLNLLLHQGYIQFMERWKAVYGEQYDSIVNINRVKIDLQQRIQEYTDDVYQTFNKYIPDIGVNKLQHNIHSRYVRSMQVNALDIVATWPTLDPTNYNNSVDLDQSRVIFADAVGPDEWHDGNISIYNILDGAPFNGHSQIGLNSIFYSRDDLQKIDIVQYSTGYGNRQYCWPYGIQLFYKNQTGAYGDNDPTYQGNPHYVWNAPVSTVNAVTQYVSATKLDAENIVIDSGSTGCFIPGYPGVEGYAQSNNAPIANHKVDALYPIRCEHVAGAQGKLGLLPSLIPADLGSQNIIGVADANGNYPIKGIPVEKYIYNEGTVVREYINGANVVKLSSGNVVKLKVYNAVNMYAQVRLRYATSEDTSIWFEATNGGGGSLVGNFNCPAPSGNKMYVNGANGKYVLNAMGFNFGQLPLDAASYMFYRADLTVTIQNLGNVDLYLDRIEFVITSTF